MSESNDTIRARASKWKILGDETKVRFTPKAILIALLLLALLLFPLMQVVYGGYNYHMQILLVIFMYIAMTSSWNIMGGFAGYISLGHNVFFAIGGYLTGALLVWFGVSPFLSAVLAGIVSLLMGFVIGFITLRMRGTVFIISTLALLLLFRLSLQNWDLLGGTNGLSLPLLRIPQNVLKLPFYYGMLIAAVGAVLLSYKVYHSKFGLGLRAISQDETKAEVAGINTRMYKIFAFAISGFFVGVAGALWGYQLSYLRPIIFLDISIAVSVMLMAYLGGKGTVSGPIIGVVLMILLTEFSLIYLGSNELNIAFSGLVLVCLALFFPQGIIGTLRKYNKLPQILDWD